MPSCVFPGSRARWSQHQLGQDRLQRLNLEGPSPSKGHVGIKLTVSDLNLSFEHVNTYHHSCISKMQDLCSKVNSTER